MELLLHMIILLVRLLEGHLAVAPVVVQRDVATLSSAVQHKGDVRQFR